MTGVVDAVEGFAMGRGPRLEWRADPGDEVPPEMQSFALSAVDGRLRQHRRIAAHEVAFLRSHASAPFKVTLPSPAHFISGSCVPGLTDRFYPRRSDLTADLAAILAGEAASLAAEGVPYGVPSPA